MTVKMVKLSDPELWPRASCRECRTNFSPNTSHFSTAAQGIRHLSFNFWKLKTNFIKRTLLPFFTKKGGLWIFLLGGWFFFVTKKEFSVTPKFWYLDQDVTTMAQINCLLSYKAFTFQLFPHYTNGRRRLTFLLVLAKNHLHSSFLWWSADQRRDQHPDNYI